MMKLAAVLKEAFPMLVLRAYSNKFGAKYKLSLSRAYWTKRHSFMHSHPTSWCNEILVM